MKTYLELNINQKINAKGNAFNKAVIFGDIKSGWTAFISPSWIFDGFAPIHDALYNYRRRINYGFSN